MINNKLHKKENDEDLIVCRIVKNGNTEAFRILIEKYQTKIFNLGFSFFKNVDDAEDFVQDVMVKAYTKLDTFRAKSKFSTWLISIAYNTAINSSKKKRNYTSFAENYDCASMIKTPEQQYMEKEMLKAVKEAICFLPENYKVCIDLYFFYDMPYAEISEITKLPINTIKSNVFRAKKILKEKLEANASCIQSNIADAYAFLFKKAFSL